MFHILLQKSCIKGCRSQDNPGLVQNRNPHNMAQWQDQDQRSDPDPGEKPVLEGHRICAWLRLAPSLQPAALPARHQCSHNEQVKM